MGKEARLCYTADDFWEICHVRYSGQNSGTPPGLRVCWVGGTRYSNPLEATQGKKWSALSSRLGSEIFVISFACGLRPQVFVHYGRFYLLPALPFALLRYVTFYALAPWLLLWLVARRNVEVVVAHDPYFALTAALVKPIVGWFGRRIVLVVESHADFEEAVFLQRRMPFANVIRRLMRWTARQSLRQADVLRAVSSSTRRQLEDWSPPGLPMHQFLTWTDLDTFTHTEREKRPSETHDLIYAGVLIPRKGVHLLLDAFAPCVHQYPDSHLWIVGSADNPDYAHSLSEQSIRLGLEGRVSFTGRMPQAELAQRMGRCRALILPSSSEGLPRVVVEAMLAAMPVVATCVAGIPDVVQEGVTGFLISPGDSDALTAALQRILSSPDVDEMGESGREFALKLFSTETYLQGYQRVMEDAAGMLGR